MMRASVRLGMVGGVLLSLTLAVPGVAQGTGRGRAQPPPIRVTPTVRSRQAPAPAVQVRPSDPRRGDDRWDDDDRGDDRWDDDDRGDDRWDDDRDDDRWDDDWDDDRDDDRWDRDDRGRRDDDRAESRWRDARGQAQRWQVRDDRDLRLFGTFGFDIRWDSLDRNDRRNWVAWYRGHDEALYRGRGVPGWFSPRWGDIRLDRDPLRYGPRPLDHRELRRILGSRTFNRISRGTPGGTSRLWGRVERFGPRGVSYTLEIWSEGRFLVALTDFDRDRWIDDVVVNGRYWR